MQKQTSFKPLFFNRVIENDPQKHEIGNMAGQKSPFSNIVGNIFDHSGGSSYVICLFKAKLSDNELKGDQNVGTYIFPESEFNHLHSNMQHFVTCKG